MKRILLLAILIAAITIGGTGCMFGSSKEPKKSVNELALEYLEQKYGEKFEYSAPAGSSYTGTRTFLATCESFGDRRVLVQIENFMDRENMVIKDDYIAMKYEDDVRELFKKMADEEFGSSKVFYSAAGRTLDPELSANASFEEYLSSKEGIIVCVISLPESVYENTEQLKSLSDKISSTFSVDELSFLIIVVDDDTFKSADEDELRQIFLARSSVAQARLDRYKWEDGLEIWENGVKILGEGD